MAESTESKGYYKVDTIANLFGVSVRRIQQLTQDGVISTTETADGRRYELVPTIQRYVKYNKNKNDISNGDIGYVTDIYLDEEGTELARLDFSDGRSVEYTSDEMDMVEHAYATTVHKSQGSEYPVVILPWLPMFYKMLRRNILYTAVTRAKARVIIVGSKKAIYTAIHNTESDNRNTRLGERVVKEYNLLLEEKAAGNKQEVYEQQVINL